jgi:outer membrane protein assembly factor BamB
MSSAELTGKPTADVPQKPLAEAPREPRLWPGLVLVAIYWIAWGIVTLFMAGTFTQFLTVFWTPMLVGAGILVWWLFFSRLPWGYRVWGLAWLVLGGLAAYALVDKSMKMGVLMYALPVALSASVLTLAAVGRRPTLPAFLCLAAASILSWGYFTLLRVDGITGALSAQRSWRWTKTAEDFFLEEQRKLAASKQTGAATGETEASPVELVASEADWPEFRGKLRDGHVRNVSLAGDWSASPPKELWRRRVGPGWSSFAVIGERAYTQEQRGEKEAVVCFDVATGNELWSHENDARFFEVVAGAGPRATPTFNAGKIFALGGSGKLNCLDAASGKLAWSRDIAEDAGVKPPMWGFSSSPLVAHGVVTVFVGVDMETLTKDKETAKEGGAKKRDSVLAYDAQSGERRWSGGKGAHSYSSAQLFTVEGTDQVLMVSDYGLEAFEPETGKLLWEHEWNQQGMFRCCQPHVLADAKLLLGTGMGVGTRLLTIEREGKEWKVTEGWTSKDLKPYFNDCVSHEGYVYGFDGNFITCIDLATGKKKWKSRGDYGYGQMLLAGDDGRALIISETGELTLAELTPQKLTERGSFAALGGKTWNHPVIAGGRLLVRNGEEMACYEVQN